MPTCSKCSDADLGRVCSHRQTLLITGEALDNFYAWVREAQQLRSTLADLIAELRAEHYPHPCTDPEDFPCCCESCAGAWPCLMADMADRAEERLREVTGDE